MWKTKSERLGGPAFNFSDRQGRFSAFLMRLDGLSGKAQGYTRLIYHLDVKATDGETFSITQKELDQVSSPPTPPFHCILITFAPKQGRLTG